MEEVVNVGLKLKEGELELKTDQKVKARKKNGQGARFKKRFIFTEKDLKALKWIAEQGVATVEQLWWVAWKNAESKSSKYADERLRDMAKAGYIKRERVFGSGTTNYIITPKGRCSVEQSYPDRKDFLPPIPKRVNDGQYKHTMALNWCRVFLEKDNQVQNWMSDRAIQSLVKRKDLNRDLWQLMREINQISPDAFFVYRGEMWLFEYEATQKNKTKYEHKAKSLVWFNTKDICWVIFVAATSGLKAILQTHFSHQRCVFFTFEELKQGKVNQFLIDRWQQVDQEEAERKHFHEQKKREAEKQLPGLKIQLEQLEMAKKSNQPEMEKAEKLWEEAFSTLNRFESGLIKLPGQRESLKEKLRVLREQYTALKKKDWELSKEITTQQHKIRELE